MRYLLRASLISRVLSLTAICLGRTLPHGSSHLPGDGRAGLGAIAPVPLCGVAPDRVYRAGRSPGQPVSSYVTFPPLPAKAGGISLLHFSWSCLRRALPAIRALWSSDFPHKRPFGTCLRGCPAYSLYYFSLSRFLCQHGCFSYILHGIIRFDIFCW